MILLQDTHGSGNFLSLNKGVVVLVQAFWEDHRDLDKRFFGPEKIVVHQD